ncbi:MAG: halocyanin [Chloroflexi bacterium]|nr:MAG: halocyanin [Chloroflexota bacterium]
MVGCDPSGPRISRRSLLKTMAALGLLSCGTWLTACGTGKEAVVEMNDELKYVPQTLTIKAGDTVTWRNTGKTRHTVTDDPMKAQNTASVRLPETVQPWDAGYITRGQSWSRRFDVPGEYTYFCVPHELAGMVATIVVEE